MKKLLATISIVLLASMVAFGQTGNWTVNKLFGATGTTNAVRTSAATYTYVLTWTKSGTVSGCTVQVETASTYGGSYSAIGSAQTCTASGQYTITGASTNYVRLNMTAWTGTGTVQVVMKVVSPPTGTASPLVFSCGATSGSAACGNVTPAAPSHIVYGNATLAANTATISSISPAFTGTTTFFCVGNDVTTRANPVQVVPASASSITITNTTGATDVIQYICVGY